MADRLSSGSHRHPRPQPISRLPGKRPSCEPPVEALPLPGGLDAAAVRRERDLERLRQLAPELPPERAVHIARLREEIRAGRYPSAERLAIAIARAIEAASEGSRRPPRA